MDRYYFVLLVREKNDTDDLLRSGIMYNSIVLFAVVFRYCIFFQHENNNVVFLKIAAEDRVEKFVYRY